MEICCSTEATYWSCPTTRHRPRQQNNNNKRRKKKLGRRGKRTRKKRTRNGARVARNARGNCLRHVLFLGPEKRRFPNHQKPKTVVWAAPTRQRQRAHQASAEPSAITASPGEARRMAPFPTPGFRCVPAPPGVKNHSAVSCASRAGWQPLRQGHPAGCLSLVWPCSRRASVGHLTGTTERRAPAASQPRPRLHTRLQPANTSAERGGKSSPCGRHSAEHPGSVFVCLSVCLFDI